MKSLKISEQIHGILNRIKREKRKKNLDDVIKLLISEHDSLKNVEIKEPMEKEDDSIKCINRILHRDSHWCVNRPPKMTRLETLDICKVCKQRRLGLTESSKVEIPQPQKENQHLFYKGKEPLKAGTVYCSFSGMYVFSAKCDGCKEWHCEVKKKKKQEKENGKYKESHD
jgi:5-formyltetrahydrofolate cyclo-ligase